MSERASENGYTPIVDIGAAIGDSTSLNSRDCTVIRNQITRAFPDLARRVRFNSRSGSKGGFLWAIPTDSKQKVLELLGFGDNPIQQIDPEVTRVDFSAAERARRVFESQGWIVNLLSPNPAGTPDLIMHKDGVIQYREVKAIGDKLDKLQWQEIVRLRNLGCDAWICDDRGVDWPKVS